ncbi:MAG: HesA/MoeB/ThiF family protein [Bacillota bacterium]|nr:HesA/MoeB/ThiF family protein [Bacillota bacterium]
MEGRYNRNLGVLTADEQDALMQKSVCIIGCGGLGGGVIENLVRMGVGKLTVVDCDTFDVTNLNRQVLSNEGNIGNSKADEAAAQMKMINSEVDVTPIHTELTEENCRKIIADHDLVIDAVDNIKARLILEAGCEEEQIPLVHGAIGGWTGQVGVVRPKDRLIHKIYPEGEPDAEPDTSLGNPSFTASIISAIEAAESIKVLLDKDALYNKLLMVDLIEHSYEIIEF